MVQSRDVVDEKLKKKVDGKTVKIKVYQSNRMRTDNDKEMDKRVKSAVKAAIKRQRYVVILLQVMIKVLISLIQSNPMDGENMEIRKPLLVVFAGPNGSGKSCARRS